jgi:hypothetical protein
MVWTGASTPLRMRESNKPSTSSKLSLMALLSLYVAIGERSSLLYNLPGRHLQPLHITFKKTELIG